MHVATKILSIITLIRITLIILIMIIMLTSDAPCWNAGSQNKQKSEQRNRTKKWPISCYHCAVMSYSTSICKLVDVIPALHESDWQIPNLFSAKTACSLFIWCALPFTSYLWRKRFTDPQRLCMMKLERHVFCKFLNSLAPKPLWAYSVDRNPLREQSVIVTSQLPAAGSCVDDVTIGQHFEITGSSDGIKCWFMSLKAHEWHKWSMHRIHGARNVWKVLFNEHQALRFQRR